MSDLEERLAEVSDAPEGPEVAAFFDLDGTLISGYSATAFYRDKLRNLQMSPGELGRSLVAGVDMSLRGADVTSLMKIAVDAWRGHDESEIEEIGERLFVQQIAGSVYTEARDLVEAHRRRGHTLVLASSATRFQAAPLARDLGLDHVLCTEVKIDGGLITGELAGPVLWGKAKAEAVRELAEDRGLDLDRSFAYANGDEDVPFLEQVGLPRPLNPMSELEKIARERDWPVSRFASRGGSRLIPAIRTGAALAGLGASAAVGLGIGLLNRSRRDAANAALAIGPDLALALGGVHLDLSGEEHLWEERPAVFIFNHQSSLDMLIVGSLVRRDLSGVAKKEAARDPRFAPVGLLVDVAYVDRSNTKQAKAALEPVVAKLREGISIGIAPEGTRSPTPRPGRFKKGAFHIAMQAGVPVVPIVIRNAGELMWRNSFFLRPGSVEATVLEPISVADWKASELDERVAEVRQLFLDTLESWPTDSEAPAQADPKPGSSDDAPARARTSSKPSR